jgi:hypothetical protein
MKLFVLFVSLLVICISKCLYAEENRINDQSLEKSTQEKTNQDRLNQRVKGFQRQAFNSPPVNPPPINPDFRKVRPPVTYYPPVQNRRTIIPPYLPNDRPPIIDPPPINQDYRKPPPYLPTKPHIIWPGGIPDFEEKGWQTNPPYSTTKKYIKPPFIISPGAGRPPWGRQWPPTSPPIYPGYEYDNYDDYDNNDSSEQHVVGVGVVLVPSIWNNDLAPVMTIVVQKVFEWGSAHFGEGSRQKLDNVVRSAEKVSYMEIYVPEAIINGLSEIVTRVGNSLNRLYIDYGRNANSTIRPVPYGRHHTWLPLRDFTQRPTPIGRHRQDGMTWYPPPIIGRSNSNFTKPPWIDDDFEQRATPIGKQGRTWSYRGPDNHFTWGTFDDDFTFDDDVTSEMPEPRGGESYFTGYGK